MFRADDHNIASSAYSPDGALLVTGSLSKKVRVWNAATHERLAEAKHDDWVWAVAFRRRDSQLATASRDKTVKLWKWDGTALAPVRTLQPHSAGVAAIAYSPDGAVIAAATTDGMLYLWDVESGQLRKSSRVSWQELRALAFSPDGKTIAVGGFDKRVELRSAEKLESVGALRGHKEWVWSVAFTPDSKTLVSGGGHFDFASITSNRPGELKLWDLATLQERLSLEGHERGVRCVALSDDGKTLGSGDFAGVARLWDVDALLDAARASPAAITPERNPFVLMGGKGVAERKFDTLAEAVQTRQRRRHHRDPRQRAVRQRWCDHLPSACDSRGRWLCAVNYIEPGVGRIQYSSPEQCGIARVGRLGTAADWRGRRIG